MLLQNWWLTHLIGTKNRFCAPLNKNINCDVVVIGGGFAGLHTAKRLVEAGFDVVLLEKSFCGGSASGRSSGFLTPDSELELHQLIRRYGARDAKTVWEMAVKGVSMIVKTIKKEGISCDLQKQDSLFVSLGKDGVEDVTEEADARKTLGYKYTVYEGDALRKINPCSSFTAGVRYPDTYGVISLLYAQGLKKALIEKGCRIFECTEVLSMKGTTAQTRLGSVSAKKAVLCVDGMKKTLNPVADNAYHAQTFLAISEPLSPAERKHLFPSDPMMVWDSQLVYSYYRMTGDSRILVGGGSRLTTYLPSFYNSPTIIDSVIREFKGRFPPLAKLKFVQYWPGLIDITKDLMPIVDTDPSNPDVSYVMGCCGLPWAAFCGDYAASRIISTKTPDYSRFLGAKRGFLFPPGLQRVLGKPASFALNNVWAKYKQVDKK